ncbi:hypothetical protein GALL_536190 [mine drainage metagenome]|uniref:Uncharacterized protein n=1 Tax=mine drainage metagenome TaxID=410659 RepID=A0A1J5PBH0_9ZZZZ
MTTWPGALKFTASTTSPSSCITCAQPARTAASSSPNTAAMPPAPSGTASCIAWARNRTSGRASAKVRLPAATSAVYSPRLCPATRSGARPPSASQRRYMATPAVNMTGWVLVVRLSCSAGPCAMSKARSCESAALASCRVSRTAGWVATLSSMPTDCEPCPGKTKANVMVKECCVSQTEPRERCRAKPRQ